MPNHSYLPSLTWAKLTNQESLLDNLHQLNKKSHLAAGVYAVIKIGTADNAKYRHHRDPTDRFRCT